MNSILVLNVFVIGNKKVSTVLGQKNRELIRSGPLSHIWPLQDGDWTGGTASSVIDYISRTVTASSICWRITLLQQRTEDWRKICRKQIQTIYGTYRSCRNVTVATHVLFLSIITKSADKMTYWGWMENFSYYVSNIVAITTVALFCIRYILSWSIACTDLPFSFTWRYQGIRNYELISESLAQLANILNAYNIYSTDACNSQTVLEPSLIVNLFLYSRTTILG